MRKPYLFLLLVIALAWIGEAACKKSDSSVGQAAFAAPDYPLAVGNSWKYKVTDFYSKVTDTLDLSITDMQALPDGTKIYRCDISQNGILADSGAFTAGNNTLAYSGLNPNAYSYFGNFKLKFPFTPGDRWIGFYPNDTVHVVSEANPVTILGQAYPHAFSLKRGFALVGDYSLVQFMLLSPGVGVINQNINIFNGGPSQNQGFDLISYRIQ